MNEQAKKIEVPVPIVVTPKERCVVILSGGLDSTTLLYDVISRGYAPYVLSVNYNQRHCKELECAAATCKLLGVSHKIADLSQVGKELLQGSALTSDIKVPEGHYAEDNMKITVVPGRNTLLLALGLAYGVSIKATKVFYGAHLGDRAQYPDCRTEFVKAMDGVARLCDWNSLSIVALYQNLTKGQIVTRGLKLGVRYELTKTCYNASEQACGKCGSCVERVQAFAENNAKDPVEYDDSWEIVVARVNKIQEEFDKKHAKKSSAKQYQQGITVTPGPGVRMNN